MKRLPLGKKKGVASTLNGTTRKNKSSSSGRRNVTSWDVYALLSFD